MAVLASSVRFTNFGNTRIHFVPVIAATTMEATRTEINAGTDLTGEISDVSGFSVTGSTIDAPDLLSTFVSKVRGRTSSEDSSLTFYASKNATDVRTVLPFETTGYIVIMQSGDVPTTGKMDVYPVQVNSVSKTVSVGDDLARILVGFAITREPKMDVTIPAAV